MITFLILDTIHLLIQLKVHHSYCVISSLLNNSQLFTNKMLSYLFLHLAFSWTFDPNSGIYSYKKDKKKYDLAT